MRQKRSYPACCIKHGRCMPPRIVCANESFEQLQDGFLRPPHIQLPASGVARSIGRQRSRQLFLLLWGFWPGGNILLQSRADVYIETAIAAHRGFLSGSLPLEVQSDSPSVVTAWFADKVPFTFRLPTPQETMGHEQIYRLTGGRLVNYKGAHAALVAYQMQQQKISLLVASSKSAVVAGGEEVPSGGIVFHYRKQANFNVITWSTHGLTYALVSSLPGTGRQSCMVCHQDMANGGRFSVQ